MGTPFSKARRNIRIQCTNKIMNLIEKAKEIYSKSNIEQIQAEGIRRESIKVSSHSHHIVTYPPLDALPDIKPSKIYSSNISKNPRDIALYLHLPFCTGKCSYCAYVSYANQSESFIDRYIDALEKEINLLLRYPILQNVKLSSVYIGGGTPTYLSSKQLNGVFSLLRDHFSIKKRAEITVEASPETIVAKDGLGKLETLLQNGANRLSIGVQTFNDNILKLIYRRHNSLQAIQAFNAANQIGFKNINLDLILGLPYQSLEYWQNDLEKIAEIDPPSVTCYPLSIKQTAAIWTMYQKEENRFPSRENVILMHIMANEFLGNLGYFQKPVWWYSKSLKYFYKQQIYKWGELGEQLALGVSGYSFINSFQYFNYRTISQYMESLNKNILPIFKGEKLSKKELMRRMIIFGLKTGLNKYLFELKFNKKPKQIFNSIWKKLENLELIEENSELIQLSYKGKLFADEVSKEFYSKKSNTLIKYQNFVFDSLYSTQTFQANAYSA